MIRKSPPWVSPPIANSIEAQAPERCLAPDLRRSIIVAKPELTIPPRDIRPAILRESSGGSSYHASAVHFDGTASLAIPTGLVAADSFVGILHFWFNADGAFSGAFNNDNQMVSDAYYQAPGFGDNIQMGPSSNAFNALFGDSTGTKHDAPHFSTALSLDTGWHDCLFSWNTNFAQGSRLYSMYIDDTQAAFSSVQVGSAFPINWDCSGFPSDPTFSACASANNSPSTVGDYADWILFSGATIVQGDGTIAAIDRRNFRSALGKPVDPSIPSAAYGTSMCLFSGDATGFSVNQGSGGAFTLTGTLTNASSHP